MTPKHRKIYKNKKIKSIIHRKRIKVGRMKNKTKEKTAHKLEISSWRTQTWPFVTFLCVVFASSSLGWSLSNNKLAIRNGSRVIIFTRAKLFSILFFKLEVHMSSFEKLQCPLWRFIYKSGAIVRNWPSMLYTSPKNKCPLGLSPRGLHD